MNSETFLKKEIYSQPACLNRLLTEQKHNARLIASAIREFDPGFVVVAARGTSDNAARYLQYHLGIETGIPVSLATPSIHTLYESPLRLEHSLVIGISQSGQSQDVQRVVKDAREQGALTLSITNDSSSPLAMATEHSIDLMAGSEQSVAATKTYTAELAAIALLVCELADKDEKRSLLSSIPGLVQETLQFSEAISSWIDRYRYATSFIVIGRGYNYCTTFEISLKLKELCYVTAQEYSEADFRHGPIAVVESGFPILTVAPNGVTYPLLVDLLRQLHARKAENLIITNEPTLEPLGHRLLPIPHNLPEWLSPICAVIPGQLFAMHLALAKGVNVDNPRYITKVTDTL
jgi:glucosamine--fructose-6-phosphate aminotransferase (isomerizing)